MDTIDLWTLDVEGGELSVLQTVDFGRLRVGVLVVETDGVFCLCPRQACTALQQGWVCRAARGDVPTAWLDTCAMSAWPAGKNATKDAAVTSLLQSVGFETVPKVCVKAVQSIWPLGPYKNGGVCSWQRRGGPLLEPVGCAERQSDRPLWCRALSSMSCKK